MQHVVFTVLIILQLCKVTYIYIVTKSINYCFVRKISDYLKSFFWGWDNFNIISTVNTIRCVYSNYLLMMNS
jgi:hypothetical protein